MVWQTSPTSASFKRHRRAIAATNPPKRWMRLCHASLDPARACSTTCASSSSSANAASDESPLGLASSLHHFDRHQDLQFANPVPRPVATGWPPTRQCVPDIVPKDVGLVIPFFGERWTIVGEPGPRSRGSDWRRGPQGRNSAMQTEHRAPAADQALDGVFDGVPTGCCTLSACAINIGTVVRESRGRARSTSCRRRRDPVWGTCETTDCLLPRLARVPSWLQHSSRLRSRIRGHDRRTHPFASRSDRVIPLLVSNVGPDRLAHRGIGEPGPWGSRPGRLARTSESIRLSLVNRDHVCCSESTDPGLIRATWLWPRTIF